MKRDEEIQEYIAHARKMFPDALEYLAVMYDWFPVKTKDPSGRVWESDTDGSAVFPVPLDKLDQFLAMPETAKFRFAGIGAILAGDVSSSVIPRQHNRDFQMRRTLVKAVTQEYWERLEAAKHDRN